MKIIPYSLWLLAHIFQSKSLLKFFYKQPGPSENLRFESGFCEIQEIQATSIDNSDFKNLLYLKKPLIVRGLRSGRNSEREIDHQFLIKNYGDHEEVTRNSIDDSSQPLKIREILNSEESSNKHWTIASSKLMEDSKLQEEIDIKSYLPAKPILNAPILNKVLFASKKGFMASLHMEPGRILNIQLSGKKRWFLVPPNFSEFIHPKLTQTTIHFSRDIRTKEDLLEKLPKDAIVYTGELKKGDALLVPPFHWHVVENHDNSVSVAYQWMTYLRSALENPFMNLFIFTCRKNPLLSLFKKDASKSEY